MFKYVSLQQAKNRFTEILSNNQKITDEILNELIVKTSIDINEYAANIIETKLKSGELDITDDNDRTTIVVKDATYKLMEFYLVNGTVNDDGSFSSSIGSASTNEQRMYSQNKEAIKNEIIESFKAINLLEVSQVQSFNFTGKVDTNLVYEKREEPAITSNEFWNKIRDHVKKGDGILITQVNSHDIKDGIIISANLKGNSSDGVSVKLDPATGKLVINHNYKNNALLVAELNAIKASIPIINNYYNKQEIDGKINTINNKFDNKQERLNDLYKLFPNNIQVHPDLSSLGIKDNQFVSYSHTDREKYIFNLMANAFKTNSRDKFITFGSSYFLYYLEVKLDRKTLLSIYWKLALEDANGSFRLSGINSTGEVRLVMVASPNESFRFIIQYRKNSNISWSTKSIRDIVRNYNDENYTLDQVLSYNTPTYQGVWIRNFDRRLALDGDDFYTEETSIGDRLIKKFVTLKNMFNRALSSAKTKIYNFANKLVSLHQYILEEIRHHLSREKVKQNLTQLIAGSQILDVTKPYSTAGLDRPANQANTWNEARGLLNQIKLTTEARQTPIQWNNNTKVATVPPGLYHILYRHILYSSRTGGRKGIRLAIFKEDGVTPAVLGTDYILGYDFLPEDIFFEGNQDTDNTIRFRLEGDIQALKTIVIKPQIKWPDTNERSSSFGHKQLEIIITKQNIFIITRKDSGEEIENIGNES